LISGRVRPEGDAGEKPIEEMTFESEEERGGDYAKG